VACIVPRGVNNSSKLHKLMGSNVILVLASYGMIVAATSRQTWLVIMLSKLRSCSARFVVVNISKIEVGRSDVKRMWYDVICKDVIGLLSTEEVEPGLPRADQGDPACCRLPGIANATGATPASHHENTTAQHNHKTFFRHPTAIVTPPPLPPAKRERASQELPLTPAHRTKSPPHPDEFAIYCH
jgi:hypothetical protein